MDALRQYVLRLTAAALICGVAAGLADRSGKGTVRVLCGMVLALTALGPLARLELPTFSLPSDVAAQAQAAADQGREMADKALADIIKARTEAYILDEAAALDAAVTVEVTVEQVEGTPVPVAAVLTGPVAPDIRERLQDLLQTRLGIPKERQQWNG